jgi:hypothetical protein
VHKQVPVLKTERRVNYDICEPVSSRRATAQGVRADGVGGPLIELASDEREGRRSEKYVVEFLTDSGKRYRKTLPAAEWNNMSEHRTYQLTVTPWGSVTRFE